MSDIASFHRSKTNNRIWTIQWSKVYSIEKVVFDDDFYNCHTGLTAALSLSSRLVLLTRA